MNTNLILATDSYKLTHWKQYPQGTETVYSYFESRPGAAFPYTVFFGLQYLLKQYLAGRAIRWEDISEAHELSRAHFGRSLFNYRGWTHIMGKHNGYLPLRIKAVPEGTLVPTDNVMMTIENTCPQCWWLTNAVESLLTHVWYPSTVATLSHHTLGMISSVLEATADSTEGLPFMLHDFGYRGASSHESAAIGGAGHLVNSMGTDTLPAMQLARDYYAADLSELAFSVPATEHSVMTALGEDGEMAIVDRLLDEYPAGILSVVADSYDIYRFVEGLSAFKERILARDGVFVVRPDSITRKHNTPEKLVHWILDELWDGFGGHTNEKGYRVLDSHLRVLWGDGIDPRGIRKILGHARLNKYSAENMVFGMGGGLLQKINRDTQRFAFKCSAQKRDGQWHDVYKEPLDRSKRSKRGPLKLVRTAEGLQTVSFSFPIASDDAQAQRLMWADDELHIVFENGQMINETTFNDVRTRAQQVVGALV